ncbi:MAG: PrsW family intramembrane metalloprotease, partial [Candidatus Eisenbacteria bacterium]|nr:PrsW family intramembrane metalloprotease [Candidatus Eisenbacteria bacterium]
LGMAATLLAFGTFRLLSHLGLPAGPGPVRSWALLYCVGLIGPIEEGAKFLFARGVCYRWKEFDEPVDGVIYASTLALGFAAAENLLYVPYLELTEQLARAVASPLTHALFASIWGFGLARARLQARTRLRRRLWQIVPLLASMVLHGLYDFAVLSLGATLVASALMLVLWILTLGAIQRALADPRAQVPAAPERSPQGLTRDAV